jgi:NAD(P)H-hydrate repair Nnr-like enzyme with NAD(P)H-hydrate epimerase domain
MMTTQSLQEMERDIERSRAQLDQTIDRLQDKMSVSGVVDDMLGTARNGPYGPLYDTVLETVRRNPVPVMLIAMGVGLLAYRLGRSAARQRTRLIAADEDLITEEHLLMEMEDSRLYGTEAAPLHSSDPMFERPGINSRF